MTRRRMSPGSRIAWVVGVVAAIALPAVAPAAGSQIHAKKPAVETRPVLPARGVDAAGRTIVVRDVSRIVPLNGDVAEILFTLGLTRNVVAVDTSATYPPKLVDALPKIGYQRTLSAEGILALKPTLVIGTPTAGPAAVLDQLRSAGVTVLVVPEHKGIDAGARKLRAIGKALGLPKRAERLAKQVEGQVALAKKELARATSKPKVAFLYLRGSQV